MRKSWLIVALVLVLASSLVLAACGKPAAKAGPAELNALFMKQAGYSEDDISAMTAEFTKANPKVKVNLTFVAYEELEPKILASAASGGYDVVLGDCIWPPKFSKAGIVLDVSDRIAKVDTKDIFQGALDSVSYDGKYYGMPWLNDCKYLFYNKSMLKKAGFDAPPATWDELATMAKAIKAKGIAKYPIAWSWSQAEALICDYTALSEGFGGGMVGSDGKPTLDAEGNLKALEFMADSLKAGLSNPKSTEMLENDVLATFVAGNAAFGLNWTYMYAAGKDPAQSKIGEDVGIAPIPGTAARKSATVNGGMPLMITAGSKHPDEAWNYILFISSKEVQKKYAKNALPIWKSLFDDPEVIATSPEVVAVSKVQYDYIRNRPQVPYYGELSTELQADIQSALLGKMSAKAALAAAQAKALELAARK
jgi:multiple sugar transport system substrate-binding protein